MPHLAFALISVLAHVAAQEARITDLVKAEYTDEGCEAAGWGPFPNATVATLVGLPLLPLGAHRREQHRGRAVPRQARRVLPSLARRPCMSKRLLYAPLVPFPWRDRRLNGSRLCPLVPSLAGPSPTTGSRRAPLPVLCLIVVSTISSCYARRRGDAVDAVIKRETLLYVGSAKSTSGP